MSLQGINMQVGLKSNGGGYMLFYWHGTGSSAGEVGFVPQAAQQTILGSGGIIISPQSSTGSTNGLTASGTSIWFDEDLTTADQMVACAVRDYGIDPHRIYSTGCSAGGLMAGHMAAQRSQYIASIATNSGGSLGGTFTGLAHIPQAITMHGATGVDVVVIDFAQQSLAMDQAIVSAGGFAVDCDHGGGHCGAPGDLYASAMQFLFDHPYGVAPEPYAGGLPPGFPSYCTIQ
jgi:predicted esterase